jgi:CRISPR-associated exonuclease Cas4
MEDPVLISELNQYLYCPRRCALIHVEGVFSENAFTLEGRFLHDQADTPGVENRPGVRVVRALPLFSKRWGLIGKADVVEFHKVITGTETPLPVEYKRGPRRKWDNDDAQLCAQAFCLEEMIGVPVPRGAIYHMASKRRREVEFTEALKEITVRTIEHVRALISSGRVPSAEVKPQCTGCSLRNFCLPETADRMEAGRRLARDMFIP